MRDTLHAEWTKFRTEPGTGWLFAAVVVLTVALGAVAARAVTCPATGCTQDPAKVALTGLGLGQAVVVVAAVAAITNEYGTGMIRTTFAAMPRRLSVLAAKAALLAAATVGAGGLAVAGSVLAGRLLLPVSGFPGSFSPTDPTVVRAAGGAVLYLVLIALLGLGIGAVVRDTAVAVGLTLGLLYLFPIIAGVTGDPAWAKRLHQISPMEAGLAVTATRHLDALPIGPWTGLAVLAGWSLAACTIGALLLRWRDA